MEERLKALLGSHKTVAIIGGQWGDEAKGKIVDICSPWADVVARGTGGANAGHTIIRQGKQHVLHLVPSGILNDSEGVTTICGSGMVIDPAALWSEITLLQASGVTFDNFQLSLGATLVLQQHTLLDKVRDAAAGSSKIGTTHKGIGPAYADRVNRVRLIVNDLLNPGVFREKLRKNLCEYSQLLTSYSQGVIASVVGKSRIEDLLDEEALAAYYLEYGERLRPFITDTDELMRSVVGKKRVLLEGAQGTLLSVVHGTQPYVTSSDCSSAGLAQGVGLCEQDIDQTILVVKAPYMTRVGRGPFPTELGEQESEQRCNDGVTDKKLEDAHFPTATVNDTNPYAQGVAIRRAGDEYGATTGRPRRTGWLDLPLLKHALRHGGILALTKCDVLDKCEEIKICTGYTYRGQPFQLGSRLLQSGDTLDRAVMEESVLRACEPVYETFPGWLCPTSHCRTSQELPQKLRTIFAFIEAQTGAEVKLISVGPDSEQTVVV